MKGDGSTSCGCWIHCGVYADEVNQAARRKPRWEQDEVAPEWHWAWPANRRILCNRDSVDPQGRPRSERKRYVWWDEDAGEWVGKDVPDFERRKPSGYVPPEGARAQEAIAGTQPFVMQANGRGWLFVPSGLADGPLPAHYEPHESPFENPLYAQRANPCRERYPRRENPYNPSGRAVPRIASVGHAFGEYAASDDYSTTSPRTRALWIEFAGPVHDERDGYFVRVLASAPDPMLLPATTPAPDPIGSEQSPLDPELVRRIVPGQADDFAGLSGLQPLVKALDSDVHYCVPLPPNLAETAPELFGFFTYEIRVGHRRADPGRSFWSTAQGRYGTPVVLEGV